MKTGELPDIVILYRDGSWIWELRGVWGIWNPKYQTFAGGEGRTERSAIRQARRARRRFMEGKPI